MLIRYKEVVVTLLIIIIIGIFYYSTIRDGHDWGGDFSMYIHHTKNLVDGVDYKDTGFISNSNVFIGPTTYPPIFPMFLSPVYYWFGLNLNMMKMVVVIFLLFSLFVMFIIERSMVSFEATIFSLALLGFNPYFWDFKDSVLSDYVFLFFIYLSLVVIQFKQQICNLFKSQFIPALLIAFVFYLAYGTRSVGLLVIPCIVALDFLKQKRITKFSVFIVIYFIVLILIQSFFLQSETNYLKQFTFHPKIIFLNCMTYIKSLSILMDNGYSNSFSLILFSFITFVAIWGFLSRILKEFGLVELFVIFYTLVIICFVNGYTRFLIPIIPFYFAYLFMGIQKLKFLNNNKKYIYIFLLVAFLFSYFAKYTTFDFKNMTEGIAKKETQELFKHLKSNTDKRDVFIFFKPRVLSLFTGRAASIYHKPDDQKKLWDYFKKIDAKYLIKGPYDTTYLVDFIDNYQNRLILDFSNADFEVYKLVL